MNRDDISYALAKQLSSATAIESNYGRLDLDEELRCAVDSAVRQILERRLDEEDGAATPGLGGPAGHLMREAEKYWKHANAKHHGAVQWISNDETGALLIFTRGEYRATLMRNIETCADIDHAATQPQADPCPQCIPGGVCKKPTCGRLAQALGVDPQRESVDWPEGWGQSSWRDPGRRVDHKLFADAWSKNGDSAGLNHDAIAVQLCLGAGLNEHQTDVLLTRLKGDRRAAHETRAALNDVLAERRRQIDAEGWTTEHDDGHTGGELAGAAACYAMHDIIHWGRHYAIQMLWPWAQSWWKPSDRRRNLVKAMALLLAEIERLDRASISTKGGGSDA